MTEFTYYTIIGKDLDLFKSHVENIKNYAGFEKLRVGTIKRNILKNSLENIGKFYTETKELNLNGDRGRIWWGRLTDVRKKEHNLSSPFPLPEFPVNKI